MTELAPAMSKIVKPKSTRLKCRASEKPYEKSSRRRKSLVVHPDIMEKENIIDSETERNLLLSDTESEGAETASKSVSLAQANGELNQLKVLLLSIQERQCTKDDLQAFTSNVNQRMDNIEIKVNQRINNIENNQEKSNEKISIICSRMEKCEDITNAALYQSELDKQRSLKNNVCIFGIHKTNEENLIQIVIKAFSKINCAISPRQIVSCYRIRGNINNIIVVKLSDYELKQQILSAKGKKH